MEERIRKSLEAHERARQVLPGGKFSSVDTKVYPVVLERGAAAHVWDVDGNQYLDYILGNGPLILGHNHPEVIAAVMDQLGRGVNFGGLNPVGIAFAETIKAAVPSIAALRLTSSGTEATFYALRIARAVTGRTGFIRFEGAYHGHHDAALLSSKLTLAPADIRDHPIPDTRPFVDSPGIPEATADDCFVAPFNNAARLRAILQQHARSIACVILEPVQRALAPLPGFLQEVRALCDDFDVLMVLDEIVTGFRLAHGGAQEYYGVQADITSLGKITGAGFPNGVVGGSARVMEAAFGRPAAEQVLHAGTFSGHPVAATAGLTTIRILQRDNLYATLHAAGERLRSLLAKELAAEGVKGQVLGVGPMWQVVFTDREVRDYRSSLWGDKRLALAVVKGMWERGILCATGRNYLSAAHTDADLDQTVAAFTASLRDARRTLPQ